MAEKLYGWAPITKAEMQDDGTLLLVGPCTDAGPDRDKQRFDQEWLDAAVPEWMRESGNVREQHDQFKAAGVAVGLNRGDDGAHLLSACIVDPITIKKCLPGPNGRPPVLKGFSIGVAEPRISFEDPTAPNGLVMGGKIVEISVVDRPSNPRAIFQVVKSEGGGLVLVDQPVLVQKLGAPELVKFVSKKQRKAMAKTGVAMPNGDFPIPDGGHLQAALGRLAGYTGDKTKARAHIVRRAKALGLAHKLPAGLGGDNMQKALVADDLATEIARFSGRAAPLNKADAATDVAGAKDAISAIARLIISEAGDLADGELHELDDLCCLLDAAKSLRYFISCEASEGAAHADAPAPANPSLGGAGDYDTGGAMATYAQAPDLAKADQDGPAPEKKPKPKAKAKRAKPQASPGPDLPAMIKSAVAEVTKAQGDQIEALRAQLTKALALPAAGGPAMMRTAAQSAAAKTTDAMRQTAHANELLRKAQEVRSEDPTLAEGYRELAAQAMERLSKS